MSDKELIKQKIEKLIERAQAERVLHPKTILGAKNLLLIEDYNKLLQFIDSLPEEFASVENDCTTCVNNKGCVTCENGELHESAMRNDKYSCISEGPVSEDLEEEINNYIKHNFFGSGSMGFFSNRTKQELNSIDVVYIARHFAEWQRKKDIEEMMKTLIGGEIVKDIHNQLSVKSEPLNDTFGKFGDKVKIIIVKGD